MGTRPCLSLTQPQGPKGACVACQIELSSHTDIRSPRCRFCHLLHSTTLGASRAPVKRLFERKFTVPDRESFVVPCRFWSGVVCLEALSNPASGTPDIATTLFLTGRFFLRFPVCFQLLRLFSPSDPVSHVVGTPPQPPPRRVDPSMDMGGR